MFENSDIAVWIFYFISLAVAFVAGYFKAIHGIVKLAVSEVEKEINIDVNQIEDIVIEKEQGQYYAYAGGDNEFLAQGKDFKDLIGNIKSRFPDRTFKLAKFDAQWSDEETQKFVMALKEYLQNKQ